MAAVFYYAICPLSAATGARCCTRQPRQIASSSSIIARAKDKRWAGFRVGRSYQLQVEHQGDTVAIVLDHHEHVSSGAGPMVMSSKQFEKWFRK